MAKYRLYYSHKKGANCMQIIPIRDLKNTVEVERRCAEENGPVFITKNGYGDMVIMSIENYERAMKKLRMYQALETSERQIKEESVKDARESLSAMRGKYGL